MPLQTTKIDIPLTGGVDEKTRTELVKPGSFLQLINARQSKTGSFTKGPGHIALTKNTLAGSTLSSGSKIFGRGDETCISDGYSLFTFNQAPNVWAQIPGLVPTGVVTRHQVAPIGTLLGMYDCTYINGFYVYAFVAGEISPGVFNIYAGVIDATNWSPVVPAKPIKLSVSSTCALSVTTAGNKAIIVFQDVANNAYGFYLDTTSAATITTGFVGPTLLVNDSRGKIDVANLGNNFVLAYGNTGAAGSSLTVAIFSGLLANTTSTSPATGSTTQVSAISVDAAVGDAVYVTWWADLGAGAGSVRAIALNAATLSALTSPTTLYASGAGNAVQKVVINRSSSTVCMVASQEVLASGTTIRSTIFQQSGGVITVLFPVGICQNIMIESHPFVVNSHSYMMVRNLFGTNPNTLICVNMSQFFAEIATPNNALPMRPIAVVAPRISYSSGSIANGMQSTHVAIPNQTSFVVSAPTLKTAISSSMELASINLADSNAAQSASMGGLSLLSGGVPAYYDGSRISEQGFVSVPSLSANAPYGAGSPFTVAYSWVAIYEQQDAAGQTHQSSPSNIITVDFSGGNANKNVDLTASTLQITNRCDPSLVSAGIQSPVKIVWYRTKSGGSVFYRINTSVKTSTDVGFLTLTADVTTDVNLGAPLYTQPEITGSALTKVDPPSLSCLVSHQDRLFGVGDDGKTIWFTGQQVYGEAPWWADQFQMYVEPGGPITALASMDGSIVVFKRDRIFFVDGQGPPDNGSGGDYSSPQGIATDVGCIEPRSVVVTPDGVMFQSLRGLELLTRGRQVATYFGMPVEDTLTANPVISSAALNEATGIVAFTAKPTESASTGVAIEWDVVHKTWSTRLYGDGSIANAAAVSAAMIGDNRGTLPVYTWVEANGSVFQESPSTYFEPSNTYSPITVVTPWIELEGLQGFQRVKKVMVQFFENTPADVLVSLSFDYDNAIVQTAGFAAFTIATWPIQQFVMHVGRQKCQAIKITVTDNSPTGPGAGIGKGITVVGISLEVGVKPILARVPTTQRA